MQGLPFLGGQRKSGVGSVRGFTGSVCQCFRQQGHARTVASRVGAFGINGPCHQFNDRRQQRFLGADQAAGFEGDRGGPRQRPAERHLLRLRGFGETQPQQSQQLTAAAQQRQTKGLIGVKRLIQSLVTELGWERRGGQLQARTQQAIHGIVVIPEIENAGRRIAALQHQLEQALQQLIQVGLAAKGLRCFQQAMNGVAHGGEHHTEIPHLRDRCGGGRNGREVKRLNGPCLSPQGQQRPGDGSGEQPDQRQGGQHHAQGDPLGLTHRGQRRREHLLRGDGQHQKGGLVVNTDRRDFSHIQQPVAAIDHHLLNVDPVVELVERCLVLITASPRRVIGRP